MPLLPYPSNITTVKQTHKMLIWQLNKAGCRTFTCTLLFKSPTGLLTKARQQVMILFGAFSTMVQDHCVDTAKDWAPTFRKKTAKKKIRVAIWSPPLPPAVDRLCPGTGKTKGEKYRLQRVKGVGKRCWKVARYTSKVTGLGMARALHWKSIHGTKYLWCLVVSFPQRL